MDRNPRGVVTKGRVRGRVSNVRRKKQKNSQIKEDCPAYITMQHQRGTPTLHPELCGHFSQSCFFPPLCTTMTDSGTIKLSHCRYNTAEWVTSVFSRNPGCAMTDSGPRSCPTTLPCNSRSVSAAAKPPHLREGTTYLISIPHPLNPCR